MWQRSRLRPGSSPSPWELKQRALWQMEINVITSDMDFPGVGQARGTLGMSGPPSLSSSLYPGLLQRSFLHLILQSSAQLFWRCSTKLSSVNVMPSPVSRGYNSFWVSSTIRQIGIVKRKTHKFIKQSRPTTEAISCIGLGVVGNQMLSAPRRAAFVIWKREDLAVVKEMLIICTTGH